MKYLFNCLSDPRRATRLIPDLWRNRIERNPGDLAYEYAVMNALATDESTEFVPTGYYRFGGYSDARIEWINATCTAFVCPLADVFADDFLPFVRRLTELVKRLRIPCVVPCVGLRAVSGDWSARSRDFAETVSAFARAVLDKSAKIGLRGETTARYLQKLGFSPDRHLSVVGCPTLYTLPPRLEGNPNAPAAYAALLMDVLPILPVVRDPLLGCNPNPGEFADTAQHPLRPGALRATRSLGAALAGERLWTAGELAGHCPKHPSVIDSAPCPP